MESFDETLERHERHMRAALREAQAAADAGEVPAGCVIVRVSDGAIVGKAHNLTESVHDPTAHAEILAITQAAAAFGDWRLTGTVLCATKEPCPMCGGAIVLARIPLVIWGADDPKRGAQTVFKIFESPGINHHPAVISGVLRDECVAQLQTFFRERRAANDADTAKDD